MTRELELRKLLKTEKIDIMFLTETDSRHLTKETDYTLEGYKTVFPKKELGSLPTRIICILLHAPYVHLNI